VFFRDQILPYYVHPERPELGEGRAKGSRVQTRDSMCLPANSRAKTSCNSLRSCIFPSASAGIFTKNKGIRTPSGFVKVWRERKAIL